MYRFLRRHLPALCVLVLTVGVGATAFATSDESLLNFSSITSVILDILVLLYLKTTEVNDLLIGSHLVLGEEAYAAMRPLWVNARNIVNVLTLGYMTYLGMDNIIRGIQGKKFGRYHLKQMVPKAMFGLVAANFTLLGMELMINTIDLGYRAVVSIGVESWESQFPRNMIGEVKVDTTGEECFTDSPTCKTLEKWFNELYCPIDSGSGNTQTPSDDCFFKIKADQVQEETVDLIPNIFLPWLFTTSNIHSAPLLSQMLSNLNGFARNILYNTLFMLGFTASNLYIMMALVLRVIFLWMFIILSPFFMMDVAMDLGLFIRSTGIMRKFVMFLLVPLKIAFTFTVGFVMMKHMAGYASDFLDHTFIISSVGIHGEQAFSYLWQVMTIALFWYTAVWCFDDRLSERIINSVSAAAQSASNSVSEAYSSQGDTNIDNANVQVNGGGPTLNGSPIGDGSALGFSPLDKLVQGNRSIENILASEQSRELNRFLPTEIGKVMSSLQGEVNRGLISLPEQLEGMANVGDASATQLRSMATTLGQLQPELYDGRKQSRKEPVKPQEYLVQQRLLEGASGTLERTADRLEALQKAYEQPPTATDTLTPERYQQQKEEIMTQFRKEMLVYQARSEQAPEGVQRVRVEQSPAEAREKMLTAMPVPFEDRELTKAITELREQQSATGQVITTAEQSASTAMADTKKSLTEKHDVLQASMAKLARHYEALEEKEAAVQKVLQSLQAEIAGLESLPTAEHTERHESTLQELREKERYIKETVLERSSATSITTDKAVLEAMMQQLQAQNALLQRQADARTGAVTPVPTPPQQQDVTTQQVTITGAPVAISSPSTVTTATQNPEVRAALEAATTALVEAKEAFIAPLTPPTPAEETTEPVTAVVLNQPAVSDTHAAVQTAITSSEQHIAEAKNAVQAVTERTDMTAVESRLSGIREQLEAEQAQLEEILTALEQEKITVLERENNDETAPAVVQITQLQQAATAQHERNTQAISALQNPAALGALSSAVEQLSDAVESQRPVVVEGEKDPFATTVPELSVASATMTKTSIPDLEMPIAPVPTLDLTPLSAELQEALPKALTQANAALIPSITKASSTPASQQTAQLEAAASSLRGLSANIAEQYTALQEEVNPLLERLTAYDNAPVEQQRSLPAPTEEERAAATAKKEEATALAGAYGQVESTLEKLEDALPKAAEPAPPAPETPEHAADIATLAAIKPTEENLQGVQSLLQDLTTQEAENAAALQEGIVQLNQSEPYSPTEADAAKNVADLTAQQEENQVQRDLLEKTQQYMAGAITGKEFEQIFAQAGAQSTRKLLETLRSEGRKTRSSTKDALRELVPVERNV
ncbi:hypothetical protein H6771_00680 [Candidatus Peribacteria bacterium]|nr:hypothetical protein [Candidatus Peribacteria bacterium]